jgi:RNA polymerase sigma-70 factor (ECF subfamily)
MPEQRSTGRRVPRGTFFSFIRWNDAIAVHYHPAAVAPAKRSVVAREALEHLDALHRFARHLTPTDADDIVQETFARALGSEEQFTEGTSLRAWLFRILRNLYIDRVRRAKKLPIARGDADDHPHRGELLRGDAELELLRSVVADDIVRALGALKDDARAVIALDLEGFSEAEIADVLSIAQGTVKSRLSRARAALREKLQEYAR